MTARILSVTVRIFGSVAVAGGGIVGMHSLAHPQDSPSLPPPSSLPPSSPFDPFSFTNSLVSPAVLTHFNSIAMRTALLAATQTPHNVFVQSTVSPSFTFSQAFQVVKESPCKGVVPRVGVGVISLTLHQGIFNHLKDSLGPAGALVVAGGVENFLRVPGVGVMNSKLLNKPPLPWRMALTTIAYTSPMRVVYLGVPKYVAEYAHQKGVDPTKIPLMSIGAGIVGSLTFGRATEEAVVMAQSTGKLDVPKLVSRVFTFSHMSRAGLLAYILREGVFAGAGIVGLKGSQYSAPPPTDS